MAGLLHIDEAAFADLVRAVVGDLVEEMRADRSAAEEHLKVPEVASTLKVTPNTVYRWISEGVLPAFKVGENTRVSVTALRAFVADHTSGDQPGADLRAAS